MRQNNDALLKEYHPHQPGGGGVQTFINFERKSTMLTEVRS